MALRRTQEVPPLRNPTFIIGLGGWSNAGEVATGVLGFLRDNLRARKFAEVEGEDFYQFTNSRPTVAIESGKIRSLSYPATDLSFWVNPDGPQDLVLVSGTEPDLRWKVYIDDLLQLAKELGAIRLCTIGGYYDSVPHTADGLCAGTSMDAALLEELRRLEIQPSTYFGPTSILTAIVWEAHQRQISAASVWGRAPHYLQVPNPKVWHEVLWRVLALCRIRLDLAGLRRRGDELVRQVNESMRDNPQLREYVAQLEASQPRREADTEPLRQDDVLRSVEDFFRREPPS